MATAAVAHMGRHYIPHGGLCYDIGASTGNISRSLADTLKERSARMISIEESREMADKWAGVGEIERADALRYEYQHFDFAVAFLVVMFMPVTMRAEFVQRLTKMIQPGGALIIVDKVEMPSGYLGTVLRRLTMSWKVQTGTAPADIVRKELSLGGVQRPINPTILGPSARLFFMFGEFAGWIIENRE